MTKMMPAPEFPRPRLASLQELATRLLDTRKPGTEDASLARDLLAGFYDICMQAGLDRVLAELEQAHPPLDITDSSGLASHPALLAALVARLPAIELDGGGPRAAKPRLLAEAVVAALGLTLTDDAAPTTTLDDRVRIDVIAALASVIDVAIALPQLRDSIIAKGRALCEERYHRAYDAIAAQLDDRGMRMLK